MTLHPQAASPLRSPPNAPSPGASSSFLAHLSNYWRIILPAVVLLWFINPQTWSTLWPAVWSPPVGLGLLLAGWLGRRLGSILVLAGACLVLLQHFIMNLLGEPISTNNILFLVIDTSATVGEIYLGWWLYQTQAGGHRQLVDPRSATLFLITIPGVACAAGAVARALLGLALDSRPDVTFWRLGLECWLDHALGVTVLTPPLLVWATPWLLRHKLIPPAPRSDWLGKWDRTGVAASGGSARLGDYLEMIGLTAGASLLCLLMGLREGRRELLGWQLWGVQFLLIVWASLRQRLRGGTLVAAAAAALPLVLRPWHETTDVWFWPLLQAHLLAQCSAALLVGAAASWVRISEVGYRQIVAHIPVVIYSARLLRPANTGRGDTKDDLTGIAEVTLVSAASAQIIAPAEDLLGDYSRWLGCIHPDDQIVVLAALEQLTRQDQPVVCEYRLAGSEPGSSRRRGASTPTELPEKVSRSASWLRDTLAPTRDTDGRLVGWEGVVMDITEQRALADDLRRTTSMFNALVTNLPAGVFFVQGPHGQPILANARARQLLGQREDTSAGLEHLSRVYRLHRPDGSLFPPDELPVCLALRQGRTTMRDDIVVHRPDGRRIPLVCWGAPVKLNSRNGGHDAAVWVMEDLTALHQAEAARKDTESRLSAVIETMAEGLIVQDDRGRIVSCNPAAATFFSHGIEELRGKTLFETDWRFVREDGTSPNPDAHPTLQALKTNRPVRNVVLGLLPGQGRSGLPSALMVRWLLINAMPLGSVNGGVGGVVTTLADITAYVQAREAIRLSEERYRGLVETLPVMVILSDRALRVQYTNPAVSAISGYELSEIAEPSVWMTLIHPEDLPQLMTLIQGTLDGQSNRMELRYRAKDSTEKTGLMMCQPRYQGGEIIGTSTLILDITRERQLERELQRASRMELIGRLSSGIAHDFNNLLGVVLNLVDLARGHLSSDHPVSADLRRIATATEQAAHLAGQLLTMSKQRAQKPHRIDLNQVAHRALDLLRATLPGSILLEPDLQGERAIMADETQVQQVLMNLCLNARDAMPRGGTLNVSTGQDTEVYLRVRDTGRGISEQERKRIFEPFYSTREGGTGLGLVMVQQIVESQGGRIDVSSTPGQGACFEIRWPLCS